LPLARKVTLADKSSLLYGALLLATGAEPIKLDVPGSELPHVHYLRTLADSRAIIEATRAARRAVIIGASFIGLEAAASLRARGVTVHVVGPEARPLERVMGAALGDLVRKLHEAHGVVFHLERMPRAVEKDAVVLDNGERIAADLVVVGVGVRPALSLAEKAGLLVDRGIVVDQYLRTSAPGVWAAGDAVRWPDPHSGDKIRVEHWVVAQRQGQTAARNILGRREKFDAVPFFWSQHYDVPIAYVGHADGFDRADVSGSVEDKDCSVAFRRNDKTLAVASIHRDRENLEAEKALEQGDHEALCALVPPAKK
jgi:NADPH-dependent 2,4-dienoyl-CoA reductase/sulfur reductase-like enzyme